MKEFAGKKLMKLRHPLSSHLKEYILKERKVVLYIYKSKAIPVTGRGGP
jgi:hypothetical protein